MTSSIGGFSDTIWETIQRFVSDEGPQTWVDEIRSIQIGSPKLAAQ